MTNTDTPTKGTRIALVATSDPYTALKPGMEGTVVRVDREGNLDVDWDCGSRLSLLPCEGDRYRTL